MASDPVRLALIGAGRMGQVHLGALRESETVQVAGVVEPLAAARSELAAAGLEVWETVDDLLAGDRPEAVLIAAPSDQHPALVATFAGAGIPMLCEKPVGVRAADAIAASGRAEQAGVLLQVGYWRRFVAELQTLRDRIAAGELGDICQISCMQWDAEPPSEQFRAHSGGIAVDMGVHEFDQVRWLSGQEVTWATAAPAGPSTGSHAPTDPDAATILAGLSGGATATISLGRRFPFQDSCWAEVWGTEGYARLPFMWDADGDEVFRSSMRRQAEGFARAVRGGPLEGAGGADAVAALTVAEWTSEALASAGRPAVRGLQS